MASSARSVGVRTARVNSLAISNYLEKNSSDLPEIYEELVNILSVKCQKKEFNSPSVLVALMACGFVLEEFNSKFFNKIGSGGEDAHAAWETVKRNQDSLIQQLNSLRIYFDQMRQPGASLGQSLSEVAPEFAEVFLVVF